MLPRFLVCVPKLTARSVNRGMPVPFNKLPVEVVEAATAAVEAVAVVCLAARTVLVEAARLGVLWIVAWHTWPRWPGLTYWVLHWAQSSDDHKFPVAVAEKK